MTRIKRESNKLRVETHGKLVALLGDKGEAEGFFRPAVAPLEKNAVRVETTDA